jgi:hypothetical protein
MLTVLNRLLSLLADILPYFLCLQEYYVLHYQIFDDEIEKCSMKTQLSVSK